jgi:hypothetical protein
MEAEGKFQNSCPFVVLLSINPASNYNNLCGDISSQDEQHCSFVFYFVLHINKKIFNSIILQHPHTFSVKLNTLSHTFLLTHNVYYVSKKSLHTHKI